MSNELTTIDEATLDTITGAGWGQKVVEGARQLWNAGTVALSVLNPTHTPPPRIPNPPRIERPAPVLPGPRTGSGGGTPPQP